MDFYFQSFFFFTFCFSTYKTFNNCAKAPKITNTTDTKKEDTHNDKCVGVVYGTQFSGNSCFVAHDKLFPEDGSVYSLADLGAVVVCVFIL